jgi:hypothetical protein
MWTDTGRREQEEASETGTFILEHKEAEATVQEQVQSRRCILESKLC